MTPNRINRFHVRRAAVKDAAAIAEVHVQCWREAYEGLIPERVLATLDVDARRHLWRRTIKHKGYDTFICIDGIDAVVGFACSGSVRAVPKTFDGEIRAIYLLEEAQGFGMGRELMRHLAEALVAGGCHSAALRVARDTSKARGFYEHLGGVDAGEDLHKVDDFNMVTAVYGWQDISVLR